MKTSPPFTTEGPSFERVQLRPSIKSISQLLKAVIDLRKMQGPIPKWLGKVGFLSGLACLPMLGIFSYNFLLRLPSNENGEWFFAGTSTALFIGSIFYVHWAGKYLLKEREKERIRHRNPGKPWLWEGEWSLAGVEEKGLRPILVRLVSSLLVGLFTFWMVLSYFLKCSCMDDSATKWFGFGLFGLIVLLSFYYFKINMDRLMAFMMYGNPKLQFKNFPFLTGNKISANIQDIPGEIKGLSLELRCIHEIKIPAGFTSVCKYFSDFYEKRIYEGKDLKGLEELEIEWPIPDKPEWMTNLSEHPSRYWELEVKGETSGLDYHARFLLPVYAAS